MTLGFPGDKKLLKAPFTTVCGVTEKLKANGSPRAKAAADAKQAVALPVRSTALRDAGAPLTTCHTRAFPFGNTVFSTDKNYHTLLHQTIH